MTLLGLYQWAPKGAPYVRVSQMGLGFSPSYRALAGVGSVGFPLPLLPLKRAVSVETGV
jgi:hypothetical protein